MNSPFLELRRNTNQARGIAAYAIDFLHEKYPPPDTSVTQRVEQFFVDSMACGVSAIAFGANAPNLLRREALEQEVVGAQGGVTLFGSTTKVVVEKAVAANCAAVREWDANGTNFGYNPARGATKGEFGHNDFYPVAVAAAQLQGWDGRRTVLAMLALDEIRGRLAEVFSLKDHKIDHVVHGAIASAAVFAAAMGANVDQIESAIGMFVAHYIPFRAIRAGKQLSDSKGASAALSAEAAVLCARRAMRGFVGPADIFRNPEAIFCLFEKPAAKDESPFDLALATGGGDFAVMGMHFKLGLYEHQSAGAIQGLLDLLSGNPPLLESAEAIQRIRITIYEPAFSIIGDPAKRDPRTRQSADHSMVYIIATLLRKALRAKTSGWNELMLLPEDYSDEALFDPLTRSLMERIDFRAGGRAYDEKYPDGIPTTIEIDHAILGTLSSGMVLYPGGHARCTAVNRDEIVRHKVRELARRGVVDPDAFLDRISNLSEKSAADIARLHAFVLRA